MYHIEGNFSFFDIDCEVISRYNIGFEDALCIILILG